RYQAFLASMGRRPERSCFVVNWRVHHCWTRLSRWVMKSLAEVLPAYLKSFAVFVAVVSAFGETV
ncbi:MAG: hypothetical protein VXW10_03875, partial [Pseudomonadota bacterium]|nr:hypothetical protein [Pseudomonadota bacterium]